MKKLMTLMLGLAFVTGTVGTCFAQNTPTDQPKTEKKKKSKKDKKNKKKTTDEKKS